MTDSLHSTLWRVRGELKTRLRGVRDARKAAILGLRAVREAFDAREAALAIRRPDSGAAEPVFALPPESRWDVGLFTRYLAGERPEIPADTLLARVQRRQRAWAVLALRNAGSEFTAEHVRGLFAITEILTEAVATLDRDRARDVRRKLEQKLADHQEPKDLMYDMLHGLRSLARYDHSAAILISEDGGSALRLVAEQIAWTKGGSRRIGLRRDLDDSLKAELSRPGVRLCDRGETGWRCEPETREAALPRLLSYDTADPDVPREVAMLCAPIVGSDRTLGVLKLSARRPGVFGDYEAELVGDFMPLASLAIQFSVRTESLRNRMVQSERKHALANLTRGITHDVNNALGAMLPLVQQLSADAADGRLELQTLRDDLLHIEKSIQTCRRIFGGMLAIARGPERTIGHGNLRRAIDGALSVLEDNLRRRAITVRLELPDELPTVRGGQGDLTQLFLNLCGNAKDAMPEGGTLTVRASTGEKAVDVEVLDTGHGIPPAILERITEPFFSTKTDGNGLGLSICRSILWDVGGQMTIDSRPGEGTRIRVSLPVLATKRLEVSE